MVEKLGTWMVVAAMVGALMSSGCPGPSTPSAPQAEEPAAAAPRPDRVEPPVGEPRTPAPSEPPASTSQAADEPFDPRQSLAPLVEKLQPAVVNIYATKLEARWNPLAPFFFPGQPQIEEQRALGSGFIYDTSNGLVVTNHHVIAKAQQVKVRLSDRRELFATVLGFEPETDLALLQVQPTENLHAVEIGDSDRLRVGDWVLAIGNPFGLSQTVTVGIVSALSRTIGAGPYDDFIQTDASINPGNSGGPLFDMNGRVVGINTAIHAAGQGIGFAIPISLARPLLDQIRSTGRVVRATLGVIIQDITPDMARAMGMDRPHGALVANVTAGGPAAAAGIEPGDVIVEFNGHPIELSRNLPTQVTRTPVGERVPVVVLRRGERRTVQATLAARQASVTPPGYGPPYGGPGTIVPGLPPQGFSPR
jgi:serine protease Do